MVWFYISLMFIGLFLFLIACTKSGYAALGWIGAWVFILGWAWLDYELKPTPTPLDVYRGNTELKITSVNGIPTDTVVVFKNK